MADVVKAVEGAKHAVLFLLFYPGSPNVAQWAADAQRANKVDRIAQVAGVSG